MIEAMTTNAIGTLMLTYSINEAIKQTPLNNRWIPLLSVALGLLIGLLVGMFYSPQYFMENVIIGIFSGANATWLNQFIKQTILGGHSHE